MLPSAVRMSRNPDSKRRERGGGLSGFPKSMAAPSAAPGLSYASAAHIARPMPKHDHLAGLPGIPEDVSSIEQWGRSVIQFGQYKAARMSYAELALAEDERAKSDVRWAKARHRSSTGLFHNLASFLFCFQAERDIAQDLAWDAPVLPWTDVHRTFKCRLKISSHELAPPSSCLL